LSLHDLTFPELQARLEQDGLRPAHTAPLWNALYRKLATGFEDTPTFPPPLRRWLDPAPALDLPAIAAHLPSADGLTQKFLLRLEDGQEIETVLMGYPGRSTACLSTQAGCAMGCVFCATGQMGFVRHLRPGEIVTQVLTVQRRLREQGQPGLRNLVLMGMGEPLHNYDATMQALRIITDPRGLNIGPGRITVSTVGVVPGIERFTAERQPYNLAVSLHAGTEEERSALVPSNRRWPLADLLASCRAYSTAMSRRVFFGWTLIAGQNDTPAHAGRVAELLRGLNAHLNLIRLNTTEGFAGHTSAETAAETFQRIIQDAGIPCTIRQRRGLDVDAGCGQLRAERTAR
jgi:23S rRNA (adenine2503-C2)-methyltransferase